MVRNGHSVILFPKWLLSNITYGMKWLWCKYIRNEMVMVRKDHGTKWLWYEMTSLGCYKTKRYYEPACFEKNTISYS